jgi:hypothetical protein
MTGQDRHDEHHDAKIRTSAEMEVSRRFCKGIFSIGPSKFNCPAAADSQATPQNRSRTTFSDRTLKQDFPLQTLAEWLEYFDIAFAVHAGI